MKSKNPKLQAWADKASAKLAKLAESTTPDAPIPARVKIPAIREGILALRPDFTWEAIVKMLKDEEIGIEVTVTTLRRSVSPKHPAD